MRRLHDRALTGPKKTKPGPGSFLNQLGKFQVDLPRRAEVLAYARRHRELAGLLPAIAAQVRAFFGPAVELTLEIYQDPEIADRYLTMYVRQDNGDPDLIDRIDDCRGRFQEKLHRVSGYLLLTTDFRKPRCRHGV